MNLINESNLQAAWTLGFQSDGRELMVVVAKATYTIPDDGGEPLLAKEQLPLTQADEFTGDPGLSATRYESDYAHRKPSCDVVLNGSAYAPRGEPVTKVTVGLQIGPIRKRFEVVGDRVWDEVLYWPIATSPQPFIKLPISYDRAYGGTDKSARNPEKTRTYLENPVGVGYYPIAKKEVLVGKPLANTREPGTSAKSLTGRFRPMSFGPVSRNFKSRIPYAGTYDKAWLENRAPFWPEDFDYRYFQAAPPEQQMPHLMGGEEVLLQNLTPEGVTRFRIPGRRMPVIFVPRRDKDKRVDAVCDTLVIEPDERRFMMTWRATYGLRRNMFELKEIIIGEMPRSWHRARREEVTGKRHFANLEELIQAKRASKS